MALASQQKYFRLKTSASTLAIFGAALLITSVYAPKVMAQNSPMSFISEALEGKPALVQAGVVSVLDSGRLDGIRFEDAEGLKAFYTQRSFEPIWIEIRGKRTYRVESALEVLNAAWTHGLNPKEYHVDKLSGLLSHEELTSSDLMALDVLTSDAIIRYIRDLSAMRVDKNMVSSTIRKLQHFPVTEDVLSYMANKSSPRQALRDFEPRGNLYSLLQAELIELVQGDMEPYEPLLPIRVKGALRPGDRHSAVSSIRQRLNVPVYQEDSAGIYDDGLAQVVMEFQRKNGLKADGIVGSQTLRVLNMDRETKIERVIVNLERLRWIAREKPDRYILVNIPSATLWAIDDGHSQFEMPVILGRKKRETVSFITDITGIRFNPNWTIPPTIKKEDFLPHLIEDPYYATNRGIEFIQGYGANAVSLDPGTIDWSSITWEEFNDIRMVQSPGGENPLGQVRVLMPNPYNIYLHDTNKPEYFKKDDRYISSGCVRVEDPIKLSHFIMNGKEGWNDQKLKDILSSVKLQEISVAEKIPVFILYQTVWLGEDGKVVYGNDVYGEDQKLINHMKNKGLFYIPKIERSQNEAKNTAVSYSPTKDPVGNIQNFNR